MTSAPTDREAMTRAEIRAQIEQYNRLEQTALARFLDLADAGGFEASRAAVEEDRKAEDWARAQLNGSAAHLLGRPSLAGGGIVQARIELNGIKKILVALNREHLAATAIETLRSADKVAPTEAAFVREWAMATARWLAATEQLDRLYDDAGGDVSAALTYSRHRLRMCTIETGTWGPTIGQLLAGLVEAQAVSASDLKKARA